MIIQATSDIYDNFCTMLNVVITPAQKEAIYLSTMGEFFSYVKPIVIIPNSKMQEYANSGLNVVAGFKDDSDVLGLGIGKFSISSISTLDEETFIRTQPLSYTDVFKMEDTYAGAFQMVAEHFFKKVEKDNYGMLESAGINMQEHIETEDINVLRDYLRKEFGVIAGSTIL